MWKPYKKVSEALMPPEVVADRFHVRKQVNENYIVLEKRLRKLPRS